MDATQLTTFGDTRRMLLEVAADVRFGTLDVNKATCIGALVKEVNANVMAEVAAAKVADQLRDRTHNFGRVVGMGKRLIGNSGEQEA